MDKSQALYSFWSSFGLPAYDENTVKIGEELPYITYSSATDSLGNIVPMSASLWYRSMSWAEISKKAEEIAEYIGKHGHVVLPLDKGYVWITKGTPFAQRMSDDADSMIRRIYLNITAEFLTAY